MTKQDQKQATTPEKVHAKKGISKKLLATLCICGGLLVGAGGTLAITANHHDHFQGRIEAAQKTKAKTSDIKIDQQAAVNKFNQKYANKKINAIKLEVDHGKYVYEIKGFDDSKEYEVTIDAQSGKVLASHSEKLDADDKEYQLDTSKAISRSEASKIAEKAAKKGTSHEWELKQVANGQAIWEVKVVDGKMVKD